MKTKRLHRCVICNKVSDISIETNIGDTVKGHFHPDPKHRENVVCEECDNSIGTLRSEYHLMDDKERIWNFPL